MQCSASSEGNEIYTHENHHLPSHTYLHNGEVRACLYVRLPLEQDDLGELC